MCANDHTPKATKSGATGLIPDSGLGKNLIQDPFPGERSIPLCKIAAINPMEVIRNQNVKNISALTPLSPFISELYEFISSISGSNDSAWPETPIAA